MRKQYVISVGNRHNNQAKRRSKSKFASYSRHWHLYFYDEVGVFHCKRITYLQALYFKTKKKYKLITCPNCDSKYIGKDECPNCA